MRKRRLAMIVIAVTGLVGVAGTAGGALAESGRADDFEAKLSGPQEVPGPFDPDGDGEADIEFDFDAAEVCFKLEWDNIAAPTAAHIHRGAAGVPGPIVVNLFTPAPFDLDQLERRDRVKGCVSADVAVLNEIAADPASFYVNIHNARFPAGAVRGQLEED
jgi:hypothetical protein